jgi:hypothetical protein
MGEVVNLRRARKTRDRTAREATAAANRLAFGRTLGQREAEAADAARRAALLDGARLDQNGKGG